MRAPGIRLAAAAATLALVVGACGGGGDDEAEDSQEATTTTAFSPNISVPAGSAIREGTAACALLTRAEVSAASGLSVNAGEGRESEDRNSSGCRWSTSGGDAVAVLRGPASSGALPSGASALSGVGDRGFITDSAAYAVSGDVLVVVLVDFEAPASERRATASDLIRKAIARV